MLKKVLSVEGSGLRLKMLPPLFILTLLFGFLFIQPRVITVSLVGDILLDRGVESVISDKGLDYPYQNVKGLLKKSGIVMGNLECTLSKGGTPVLKDRYLTFQADPENAAKLRKAGFTVLNLANNHAMDFGSEGLLQTLEALQVNNLSWAGAGHNREESLKPLYIHKEGTIIGFLSFSAFPPEGYFYFEDRPNVAHINEMALDACISQAKESCDILLVSFHWGREFDFYPNEQQKNWAHRAIDHGADMVIGHHPHVLQGIEQYKGKMIFYSLGNFIFDRQIPRETDKTIIVNVKIRNRRIQQTDIIPVAIENSRPRVLTGEQAETVLKRLELYSEGI